MQQADEYLESEKAINIAKADLRSSRQGAFVTAVGIPIALFALLTNTESIQKCVWDNITNTLNSVPNFSISSDIGMLIYSTIASIIVAFASFKYLHPKTKKGKSNDS